MKYAIQVVSGAMTYISTFIKIDFSIQKLMGGTETAWRFHKPTYIFFQNKESRLMKFYSYKVNDTNINTISKG
jgi:hypothetical protein